MTPPFFPHFKREKPPHGDIQLGLTFSYAHQPRGLMSVSLFPASIRKKGPTVYGCSHVSGREWTVYIRLEI